MSVRSADQASGWGELAGAARYGRVGSLRRHGGPAPAAHRDVAAPRARLRARAAPPLRPGRPRPREIE